MNAEDATRGILGSRLSKTPPPKQSKGTQVSIMDMPSGSLEKDEPQRSCEEPAKEEGLDLSPKQLNAIAGGEIGNQASLKTCPYYGSDNLSLVAHDGVVLFCCNDCHRAREFSSK